MNNIAQFLLVPALLIAAPCVALAQAGADTASSPRDVADASPGHSTTGMSRVTEKQIESQLTAKVLIGSDVHGSDGEKIGEVVDIVLAPSLNAHGASSTSYSSSSTRSATTGSGDRQGKSGMPPAVIVSTGGMLGVGDDLVRIPISRISYNADKKEVRLNVSETEWKALRSAAATGGVSSTTR